MNAMRYSRVKPALAESNLAAIAPYMFWLMFRNVASDGLVFEDPERSGVLSQAGCVLASPSWENTRPQADDHPWAVSTANFAELYYRLARQVTTDGTIPFDGLSAGFFGQVGIGASATPAAAAAALQAAGDQMLQAVVFHSDHLELSEQFDATTGYEKSVSNLSWSYASFLSAVRARSAI